MEKIADYKKRVKAVVAAIGSCRYGSCSKCPYQKDGCQNRLFSDASEILEDYLENMKEYRDL